MVEGEEVGTMRKEQCSMCREQATAVFRRISTDEMIPVCLEHVGVLQRSVEMSMREIERLTIHDQTEFAALGRSRSISAQSARKLVEAHKREIERCRRAGLPAPKLSLLVATAMQAAVER